MNLILKTALFILLFVSVLANAQTAASVITDPTQITSKQKFDIQPFTVEKLYMTRNVGDSSWSPDDKQVAFVTNMTGRNNIWLVPSQSGWPTQLTVSNQRQANIAWSPKGRWIAYNSDYDGNEQWDLFLVSVDNGQVVNLTNSPEVSEEGAAWSPDGEKLAYSVKPKRSPNYEIDTIEILTKKVTHVTSNTPPQFSNSIAAWSHDGKWIVYNQSNAAGKDGNVFIVSAAGGKPTNLTPHEGEKNFTASDLSPDGKTVLMTSNAGNGYANAALLDIATKKITWLTNDKVGGGFRQVLARWQAPYLDRQLLTATRILISITPPPDVPLPCLWPKGLTLWRERIPRSAMMEQGFFTPTTARTLPMIYGPMTLPRKSRTRSQILLLAACGRRYGCAVPGSLSQQRRQMADLRFCLCPLQRREKW